MIQKRFGHRVVPIIRTAKGMALTITANPYLGQPDVDRTKNLLVTIQPDLGKDEWQASGANIYLYYPNGYGRIKLTNNLLKISYK